MLNCSINGFFVKPCLVKFFWEIDTVALSFVFDKYCSIMD